MISSQPNSPLPIIGTPVTYHGSLTDYHGRTFFLFPHHDLLTFEEADDCECDPRSRRTLRSADPDTNLAHVRESSFTAETSAWWPEDSIDITCGGFVYKASHALPGGSPSSRILAYYAGNGRVMTEWCTLGEMAGSDTVRTLDERGLDPFRSSRFHQHPDSPLCG
ncbi:hypothetical protein ACWCWD_29570 [Streptomyces sp. NPDC001493]